MKAQNRVVNIIFGSSVQSTYSIFQFQKVYDYLAAIKIYGEDNSRSQIIYI